MTATVTEIHGDLSQLALIARVVTQFDNAGEFLATVPGVKVTPLAQVAIPYYAESAEEIDEIAAAIKGTPRWNQNHYVVEHRFGPEVIYQAVWIDKGREDDSAQPEGPVAA